MNIYCVCYFNLWEVATKPAKLNALKWQLQWISNFIFEVCRKTNHKLHVIKLSYVKTNRLSKLDAPINSGLCIPAWWPAPAQSRLLVRRVFPHEWGSGVAGRVGDAGRVKRPWLEWNSGLLTVECTPRILINLLIFSQGKNLNCMKNLSHTAKNLQKSYRDTVQEEYN